MPQKQKVDVKLSKPHRRKGHWVHGYWMRITKAFRIRHHKRQPRRTQSEIKTKGTRKGERKGKKPQPTKSQRPKSQPPKQSRNWRHPFRAKKERQSEITDFT